jgi:hypothetical protein
MTKNVNCDNNLRTDVVVSIVSVTNLDTLHMGIVHTCNTLIFIRK